MSAQGHIGSPLLRSLRGLSFIAGLLAAFAFVPKAYEQSAGYVWRYTFEHYGPEHVSLVLLGWKVVLALLAYSLTTAAINLVLSALGLSLALKLMNRERELPGEVDPATLKRRRKSSRRLTVLGVLAVLALVMELFR